MVIRESWIYIGSMGILIVLIIMTFIGPSQEDTNKFYIERYKTYYCKEASRWEKNIKVKYPAPNYDCKNYGN